MNDPIWSHLVGPISIKPDVSHSLPQLCKWRMREGSLLGSEGWLSGYVINSWGQLGVWQLVGVPCQVVQVYCTSLLGRGGSPFHEICLFFGREHFHRLNYNPSQELTLWDWDGEVWSMQHCWAMRWLSYRTVNLPMLADNGYEMGLSAVLKTGVIYLSIVGCRQGPDRQLYIAGVACPQAGLKSAF